MKYSSYLLYCDIDGTLTGSGGAVLEENREAIREFIREGGQFSVATGRGQRNVEKLNLEINAPCILHNGAVIYDPEKRIETRKIFMSPGAVQLAEDLYQLLPDAGVVICREEGNLWLRRGAWYEGVPLDPEDRMVSCGELQRNLSVLSVSVSGKNGEAETARDYVQTYAPSYYAYSSYPDFLDITSFMTSKGSCLKNRMQESSRIVIACGDGENDAEMLKTADYGIAVGNACSAAKEAADLVIEDRDHPVIRQILQRIDEGKIKGIHAEKHV